jgi:hypothetical protein
MPLINTEQAVKVAEKLAPIVKRYTPDPFDDPRYYPPRSADIEDVTRFFLVLVAMDHRLSRPGRPYEAIIDGKLYHGADLLYRLGKIVFDENSGFFDPRSLAKIREEDILRWLCIGKVCPPDPGVRAALLRDLGRKLLLLYDGSAYKLVEESRGLLHSWDPGSPGFVERLRVFEAYGDPVEKKPMLLAKFLERRGILTIRDKWNQRVPVDNHVTRIALRLGIVELEEPLRSKLVNGEEFTPWEDIALRVAVREVWHIVATRTGVEDFVLDDILWTMGRKVCIPDIPRCNRCENHPVCSNGSCSLAAVCPVARGEARPINEHKFLNTWWY